MNLSNKSKVFVQFLPFLVIYVVITIFLNKDTLIGDENRYDYFATNLTHGYYSLPMPNADFTNGPGYPIVLALFYIIKSPFIVIKLFNAVLLYLSVVLIYLAARKYASKSYSLALSLVFACYFPFYQYLPMVLSEIISVFLLCLFFYLIIHYHNNKSFLKRILFPSMVLGFLVLTKIAFSYISIVAFFILLALRRLMKDKSYVNYLKVIGLALVFCIPYLVYTHSITGKLFYWGGSMDTMYWMSSPHKTDLGDWNPADLRGNPDLIKNHQAFFDSIQHFNSIEKDAAFQAKAIQNIKNHPSAFVKNVYANVGRMFFNYPFSADRHKDLWGFDLMYMFINMFFVVALFVLIGLSVFNFNKLSSEVLFPIIFILIYLAVSSIASAEKRMFFPAIPLIVIWLAYFSGMYKIVRVNTNPNDTN